ncbi:unnamed protein product [Effrenium voratum]|uniref:Uncharacterized protein n=1 Tax=Effrenium voratum TaxID=2562239 RepID=A0AA36MZU4_9DINO|nr:unnamed protein product [Effrenium voratum]
MASRLTMDITSVLGAIRNAQSKGFGSFSPYSLAKKEILAGKKLTHWMWYVWPSLRLVRSNVKQPQFLLPSWEAVSAFLDDNLLRFRLCEITEIATSHLVAGVSPDTLFGKQARIDVAKFRECMQVFLASSLERDDPQLVELFLKALRALRAPQLDAAVKAALPRAEVAEVEEVLRRGAGATSSLRERRVVPTSQERKPPTPSPAAASKPSIQIFEFGTSELWDVLEMSSTETVGSMEQKIRGSRTWPRNVELQLILLPSAKSNNCILRFTVFTRCARELGEEDTRCKYQYYRAQCTCPESQLEDWMEHRARGSCHLDVLPDRSTVHVKQ